MLRLRPTDFRVGDRVLIEAEQAEDEAQLHLLDAGEPVELLHGRVFHGILKNGKVCGLAWLTFYLDMEYEVTR